MSVESAVNAYKAVLDAESVVEKMENQLLVEVNKLNGPEFAKYMRLTEQLAPTST